MSDLVVTVEQGDLRGVETDSVTGGSYLSFRGIPYAARPVGDLRFRDPQAPKPWSGVRDASKEGSKCAQFNSATKKVVGQDDCLYLNVATASLTGSRPVMFWIHGGGFSVGDGGYESYSPDYLMGSGIVYVGVNYRLGVLGFLNLDHEVAPGNVGLKDQVAALKWVKENIAQFGGDPNNVTIFGESAGGASVHYLLLSPLAKGLFHKAVMQSGSALNPWAHNSDTVTCTMARCYTIAALGKDSDDPIEIVEYLRTLSVKRLIEVQELFYIPDGKPATLPFGPSTDDKSIVPFLPKPPGELLAESSDVPVIIGHNSHEGLVFLAEGFMKLECRDEVDGKLAEYFESLVPRDLVMKAPSKVSEMATEIRKLYFGEKRITKDLINEYIHYWGDTYFGLGIHRVVMSLLKNKSPTFFYRFSYDSPDSLFKQKFGPGAKGEKVKGTMHGEDLFYLFFASECPEFSEIRTGSVEDTVRNIFVRLWTDFAKTGNPTPSTDELITVKWDPVTQRNMNYLDINGELSNCVIDDVWDTWQRIYARVDNE